MGVLDVFFLMSSSWEIETSKEYNSITEDLTTDVCIVGGGLTGLWCAYLLSEEGRKVVVLEKDRLASAETKFTTALITQVIDTDLSDLVRMFGEEGARLSWLAGEEALDQIEEVQKREKIPCEFMRLPLYSYASSGSELRDLEEETELAKRLGFKAKMISSIKGFSNVGAMQVENQAKYHPMKFIYGLAKAAEKNGVQFFEDTEVLEVCGGDNIEVRTKNGYSVSAKDVIVATYSPLNNPKPTHWKKGMYKTYVYELEVAKGRLEEGIYEDQANPYHYFRIDDLGDKLRLIVGGEDHREEINFDESKCFRALKWFVDETFLDLDYKIKTRWSGQILEPSDGLPLIGEYAPREYLASAFSGNGMTYAALAGQVLRDLIMGRESKYQRLYDPRRKMRPAALAHKFKDYAGEFFGGAVKNLFK